MRARLVPSRRAALVFVGVLGAVLAAGLASESARVPQRTPLVPRHARGEPVSIPLEGRESRRGAFQFRLALRLADPAALGRHAELWLFLASATPARRLLAAELRRGGSACLRAAPARLDEGQPLVFVREQACSGSTGSDLVLTVEVQGAGALSLLGFEPQSAEPGQLQALRGGPLPASFDVRGHFVDYPATAARIVLLGHMWRLSPGPVGLASLVSLGVGLALAGCLLFPVRPLGPLDRLAERAVPRAGAAAALLAGSLALVYAVVAPPLSAPDEPYHLLGFAELNRDPALAVDVVAWMGETHLWRIRYQPSERFRTIDVGRPYVEPDPQLRPTEVEARSAVLAGLWRAVGPAFAGRKAHTVLLGLRLLNVLAFALAVGLATAVAVAAVVEPYPQWLAPALLALPSLCYFAMPVSETALLAWIYVWLGTGLAVLVLGGPRSSWAGGLLGVATGLMLASGRSPWPLAGLVATVLAGRVLLGPSTAAGARRAAVVFWGSFTAGAAVFVLAQNDAYRAMTDMVAFYYAGFIPSWLRGIVELLRAQPAGVAVLTAGAAMLEIALTSARGRLARRFEAAAERLVPRAAGALGVLLVLSLTLSLFVRYPELPLAPAQPLDVEERLVHVLGSMATMFRLSQPDFLLHSSFWVGFGWLDTMPGRGFQALLVLLLALAVSALLAHVALRRAVRLFLWLLVLAAGAVVSLVLYTLATQATPMALGGRYLIGWYLAVIAVIGTALTFDYRPPDGRPQPAAAVALAADAARRGGLLLVVAGSVHAYCLWFILARYF